MFANIGNAGMYLCLVVQNVVQVQYIHEVKGFQMLLNKEKDNTFLH